MKRPDGTSTETTQEALEELLKYFFPRKKKEQTEEQERTEKEAQEEANSEEDKVRINIQEIDDITNDMDKRKAPGEDGLNAEIIRKAIEETEVEIVELFNKCLEKGKYPKIWKKQLIIKIKKKGKTDPTKPENYRPISLIPTIGKILDAIIIKRIEHHLENNEYEGKHNNQYGFRKGKSTIDAIRKITKTLKEAREEKKYATLVTIDIKAAFDRAWRAKIIQNLKEENVPKNLIKMTKSYFEEREAKIREGETEATITTEMGCPQGSKSGPGYWKIFFNKILNIEMEQGTEVVTFADDTAIVTTDETWKGVKMKTENNIKKIMEWAEENNITINAEKTEGIFIKKQKTNTTPTIKIGEEVIKLKEKIKYLGIIINDRLKWDDHVDEVINKAKTILNQLTPITYTKEENNSALKTIYEGAIEPGILYAAEIWGNSINKKTKKKMDSLQRKVAIKIIRGYNTISTEAAIVLAKMVPIHMKAEEREEIYAETRKEETEKNKRDHRHPARKTKIKYGRDQGEETGVRIYTDGSKIDGRTGAAYIVYDEEKEIHRKQIKTSESSTVYQCELIAIQKALDYIEQRNRTEEVTIITDSKAALETIKHQKKLTEIAMEIVQKIDTIRRTKIKWKWVRAHNGNKGNEAVDKLAKEATEKEETEVHPKIARKTIKSEIRKKTKQKMETWWRETPNGKETKKFFETVAQREKIETVLSRETIQLITGHGAIPTYLEKIKKRENGRCLCELKEGTPTHLILECSREEEARGKAERKLIVKGLRWPKDEEEMREISGTEEWWEALNSWGKNSSTIKELEKRE